MTASAVARFLMDLLPQTGTKRNTNACMLWEKHFIRKNFLRYFIYLDLNFHSRAYIYLHSLHTFASNQGWGRGELKLVRLLARLMLLFFAFSNLRQDTSECNHQHTLTH